MCALGPPLRLRSALTEALTLRCDRVQLLVNSFNPAAAEGVMCRDTVSVGWDGRLYDCDFNQQLALGLRCARGVDLLRVGY